jgi:glycosyltransferase involved in cell wall biosynthesis
MIRISAVVCTYNRASLLAGALDSLVQQSLDSHNYEIMVVDNACTDETPAVVRALQEEHPEHNIVSIYESKQGLGHARNAALEHARSKYVAYLDDDALANPDWLKHAVELFETIKPTPICVGGPILPFYTTPKPTWFKDKYETRSYGSEPRFLREGEPFTGANMVWSKEVAQSLGGFSTSLGPKGTYLWLGDETALFDRVWRSYAQPSLYYSPELSVRHLVTPYQMTVAYRLKWELVYGQARQQIYSAKSLRGRLLELVKLSWGIAKVGALALWQATTYEHWQNWLVEGWGPVARKLGIVCGILGLTVLTQRRGG